MVVDFGKLCESVYQLERSEEYNKRRLDALEHKLAPKPSVNMCSPRPASVGALVIHQTGFKGKEYRLVSEVKGPLEELEEQVTLEELQGIDAMGREAWVTHYHCSVTPDLLFCLVKELSEVVATNRRRILTES